MGATALALLRTYRRTALLLGASAAVALWSILPARWLAGGLLPAPLAVPDPGLSWSSPMTPLEALRQQAVDGLAAMLLVMAWAVVAVAVLTLLALGAARTAQREREVAVRRAVGASRRMLLGGFLIEGLVIAAAALAAGGVIAAVVAWRAAEGWPGPPPDWAPAAGMAPAVALALVIVFGTLFPILFARRPEVTEPADGSLALRIPALLIGASLAVLATGVVVSRHARSLALVPEGALPAGVVVPLRFGGQAAPDTMARLLGAVARIPGLERASLTSPGAVLGLGAVSKVRTDCGDCAEGGLRIPIHVVTTTHQYVSADSFRALGLRLLEGRGLSDADRAGGEPVAVVGQALAQRHFQYGQAVGRIMMVGNDPGEWYRVVGVVEDRTGTGLGATLLPPFTVYLSILQHPVRGAELQLQGTPGAIATAEAMAAPLAVGPGAAAATLVRREQAPLGWFGRGYILLGLAMLVAAAVGTFTLMRLWVLSLAPEMAIWRAVGAPRRRVAGVVLGRTLVAGFTGALLGLWLGPACWEAVAALVPGLGAWQPEVLLPLALLLMGTALLGAVLPLASLLRRPPALLFGVHED